MAHAISKESERWIGLRQRALSTPENSLTGSGNDNHFPPNHCLKLSILLKAHDSLRQLSATGERSDSTTSGYRAIAIDNVTLFEHKHHRKGL